MVKEFLLTTKEKMQEDINFFKMFHSILEEPRFQKLSPATQMFYVYFKKVENRWKNSEGSFYRTIKNLKEDTKFSEPTIIKSIHELELRGFVKITKSFDEMGKERLFYIINKVDGESEYSTVKIF